MRREASQNLSGNEGYYIVCSLLAILKNSCSRLHHQKGLIQFSFHINLDLRRVSKAVSEQQAPYHHYMIA